MSIRFIFAVAVVSLMNASAFPADNCENPQTSYDRTYCAAKLFIESDQELNAVYKELKGMLKPEVQK